MPGAPARALTSPAAAWPYSVAQRALGRLGPLPLHAEAVAAAADLHPEARSRSGAGFIERPAQVREPRVVGRLELEFAGDGHGGGGRFRPSRDGSRRAAHRGARAAARRPRRECGRASVTHDVDEALHQRAGPPKLTQRLFSVRPASSRGVLLRVALDQHPLHAADHARG